MVKLSFNQSNAEVIVRATSTLLFATLKRAGCTLQPISELTDTPQYGYTASASIEPVGPRFVRITDLKDGRIDWKSVPFCQCDNPEQYVLLPNDILFARTGATTGKTHLVSDAPFSVFASYLIRLRALRDVTPEYLYWFFQSDLYWQQIVDEKEGSAQPNVNGRKLQTLVLPVTDDAIQSAICCFLDAVRARQNGQSKDLPPLPQPIADARRIVARIEDLSAKIEEARDLQRQVQEEAVALDLAAAAKLLSAVRTARSIAVDELCEVRGGIQKSSIRTPGANPRRYITVAHVQRNRIDTGDPRYFEVSGEELERWRLLSGDVLVIEGNGSADQIGRAALFAGEIPDCVHQNHVIRVRPKQDRLLPEYLNAYLNSPVGRDQMLERSRTTSGLFNLSVGRIKSIELPLPTLSEQSRVVSQLDTLRVKIDFLQNQQEESNKELDALMPSILSKAFSGKL